MAQKAEWWKEGQYFGRAYLKMSPEIDNLRPDFINAQVDLLESLLPSKNARILEIACGVGQVSVELARRGYSVTAIDLNAEYLCRARARARRIGVTVHFKKTDMRTLGLDKEFDAVICCGTSIGYFRNEKENRRAFEEMSRVLVSGGILILETWVVPTLEQQEAAGKNRWTETMASTGERLRLLAWKKNNRCHIHTWFGSSKRPQKLDYRIYPTTELRSILCSFGLRPLPAIYLDYWQWAGRSKSARAWRRVMVAQK